MDNAVLEFGEFAAVPSVGGADEVAGDTLQAVDVVAVLEKENEKSNNRKINNANQINFKKETEQKKKIITSLNDPLNPYSALFYNNMLINNYKVRMHYNNMEQGVPYLRTKKLKKSDLPPLNPGNNLMEETMISKTYSSGFNSKKKKKLIILPSTFNEYNRSNSKNKIKDIKENKIAEKDIEAKVLFQSYGEQIDCANNGSKLLKVNDEINDNKKKLSGIIEEDN